MLGCATRRGSFAPVFLQAAGGIRDYKVTGVQTCALPISLVIHRVFAYVALAIGLGIGFAIFRGAGKIDLFGRAATVALTIAAVILGQFIFVLVTVAKIGRASCRGRVEILGVAGSFKKKM